MFIITKDHRPEILKREKSFFSSINLQNDLLGMDLNGTSRPNNSRSQRLM
jgi:hypothetical protein